MHENGFELINKDGYKEGNWILLDYNDIIVHIFLPEDCFNNCYRDQFASFSEDLSHSHFFP